jgi:tetratricopeptide (TPR) repeat protein
MAASQGLYDRLNREREQELRRGNFRRALELGEEALQVARKLSQPDIAHQATSNLSAIQLELGEPKLAEKGLRQIILRSRNPLIICAAAYNLAISMRRQKRFDRAGFYAEMAMERAQELKSLTWLARCHNLLGNIRLCQSDVDGALKEYRSALQHRQKQTEDTRFPRAILLDNIGYCWLLKRQYRKGLALVEQALQLGQEVDARRCIAESLQDLCFGYMKLDEFDKAAAYGRRSLLLGRKQDYGDIVRNCYYLLSEVYHLAGKEQMSDRYLGKLQTLYPNIPFLRDFLRTFDVSNIIALKNP